VSNALSNRTATCACGDATITVRGEPEMYGVCHCNNCRRRTGSAFGMSSYFKREQVVERRGEMREYAFHHAEMNHDQSRHFCARCGTTLYWTISTLPELIGVAAGCFSPDSLGAPNYSVNTANKWDWVKLPAGCKVEM
jgi:hypothetical protein